MQILGIMDNSQHVPGAVTAVVTTYEPDLQTLEAQFEPAAEMRERVLAFRRQRAAEMLAFAEEAAPALQEMAMRFALEK